MKIPVHHKDPNCSWWIPHAKVLINGIRVNMEPTYITPEIYRLYSHSLLIGPINYDLMVSLFGRQYFPKVSFYLDDIEILDIKLLKRLAHKIGFIEVDQYKTKKKLARAVRDRFLQEMKI